MFPLVGYVLLFLAVGVGFILVNMLVGKLVRPANPDQEKGTIYECGEPTIGSAWVQFDLRFYVVALLFVIFDVEVAFFFPWAVVFGQANAVAQQTEMPETAEQQAAHEARLQALSGATPKNAPAQGPDFAEDAKAAKALAWIAFWDIIVFFGVLLVGFAYLWKRGDLQWVRNVSSDAASPLRGVQKSPAQLAGTGS